MQSPDHQRDEGLKAKRRETGARGERAKRLGWASALGNAAVQRLLRSVGVQRSGAGGSTLDESVAKAIQAKRGTGQTLDQSVGKEMKGSLGQDFSDVNVHTDADADALSRAVKAEAFTTGRDVFFGEGKYDPGSSEGRKLLAHELTHVVQQRAAPPSGEMRVSSPDDASERQASAIGDKVGAAPSGTGAAVDRQEEEEEMQMSWAVDRQEEEEEIQMSPAVDRQEEEEEMQMSPAVDRQEEEEEEMQTSPAVDRQVEARKEKATG